MKIYLYFTDKTPAQYLPDYAAGVTTHDKLHSGQLGVKRIIDVQVASEGLSIFCEPLVAFAEPEPEQPTEAVEDTLPLPVGHDSF